MTSATSLDYMSTGETGGNNLNNYECIYSEMYRLHLSLIMPNGGKCSTSTSTASKIEGLKKVFNTGRILESIEDQLVFSTFHFEFIEDRNEHLKVKVRRELLVLFNCNPILNYRKTMECSIWRIQYL